MAGTTTAPVDRAPATGRSAGGGPVAVPAGRDRPAPWGKRLGGHAGALAVFAVPAVVLWWHAWDGHLASTLTCACGDAGQAVWFVAWPAYALAHGLDPFFSGALQAPYGVNLLDNASSVPVGLVLAPVTWVAGPVVSLNVALTLCPALSAWAAWVACRPLVRWQPAAVAAGFLYGYSPFVVDNLALGHVSIALLVVPPLLVRVGHRLLLGPPSGRLRCGVAVGALVALQFLLSSEVLAVVAIVGIPAAAVAWLAAGARRPPGAELARALGAGALVGALLLAAPVWFFLAGAQHLTGPLWSSASIQGNPLHGLWDPGPYRAAATTLQGLGGYEGSRGPPSDYLGPVLLALLAGSVALTWRRRAVRVLVLVLSLALTFSFGIALFDSPGHLVASWMPWRLLAGWPLLDDLIPQRFSVVVGLSAALLVGIGLDRARETIGRWAGYRHIRPAAPASLVIGAAIAALLPVFWTYQVPFATGSIDPPAWFRTDAPHLAASTVVLTYPFAYPADGVSGPMVWQAEDGMGFRLAGGYVKAPAAAGRPLAADPGRQPYAFLAALSGAAAGPLPRLTPPVRRSLREALRRWRVGEVVVTGRGRDPALAVEDFTALLGRPPSVEDGARVWALDSDPQRAARS